MADIYTLIQEKGVASITTELFDTYYDADYIAKIENLVKQ